MRHRKTTPTLQRSPSHRKAVLRTMVTQLLRHERLRTTQAKAKALRRVAEKMITLGKRESLHARRNAARTIRDKGVVKKLFDDLAPRYAQRPGGYTRIIKLPSRPGDGADMAIIELVEAEMETKPRREDKPSAGPRTAAQDAAAAAAAAETEAEEATEEEPEVEAADDSAIEESQQPEVAAAPDEEVVPDREELHETEGEEIEDPELDKED